MHGLALLLFYIADVKAPHNHLHIFSHGTPS